MEICCEDSFCVYVKLFFGILANENISSHLCFHSGTSFHRKSALSVTLPLSKKRLNVKIESYFNFANPKSVLPSEFPGSLGTCSRYLKFAKNIMKYFSSDKLSLFIGRKALENTLKVHSNSIYTNINLTLRRLQDVWSSLDMYFSFCLIILSWETMRKVCIFSEIPYIYKEYLGSYMFEKSRHVLFAYVHCEPK